MFSERLVAVTMISSLLLLFAVVEFALALFVVLAFCARAGVATPVSIVVASSSGVQAPADSFDFGLRSLIGTPPCSGSESGIAVPRAWRGCCGAITALRRRQ